MWTIPDKGEGDNDLQSILFQEDIDILIAAIQGVDCVLSGLAVTGGADMTPAVAKGAVLTNSIMKAVAAADVTIGAADGTNPRIDLIVVNSAGALAVRAGTAAANPKPPARSTNDVVIAFVYVAANDTSIETTKIIDKRVPSSMPQIIYRTTVAEVTNTSSAETHILDKTNSGVSIPNGLFLAGRQLRVRIGGNYLLNNSTPTVTIRIKYGATTLFGDVSLAGAADADRGAWFMEFLLTAQGNADQALIGFMTFANTPAGRIAGSVAGIGDILGSVAVAGRPVTTPFSGAAAIDSDAANVVLAVTWQYSVSHANDEVVVESATVELL